MKCSHWFMWWKLVHFSACCAVDFPYQKCSFQLWSTLFTSTAFTWKLKVNHRKSKLPWSSNEWNCPSLISTLICPLPPSRPFNNHLCFCTIYIFSGIPCLLPISAFFLSSSKNEIKRKKKKQKSLWSHLKGSWLKYKFTHVDISQYCVFPLMVQEEKCFFFSQCLIHEINKLLKQCLKIKIFFKILSNIFHRWTLPLSFPILTPCRPHI